MNLIPGASFLACDLAATSVFTVDDLGGDAQLMAQSVERFMREEVLPNASRIEAKEPGLMEALLRKSANLGLLGIASPVRFGGLALTKAVEALLCEHIAIEPSFAVSHGVHTGVAQLPLVYFGTDEQKQRILPKLTSGEWLAAYALSEAGSGSDALAAKTRADLAPGATHYTLNGAKMWITNAGFANVFTLFAKVGGERFTAFLVEREWHGVGIGPEEHKLGLRGSSTARLTLDDVKAPLTAMLGEEGAGHKVALYVLNIGRFKIAAGAVGAAKELLAIAVRYANQRVQFGEPLSNFGLIQDKLATMAVRILAAESALYRTAGLLDGAFADMDPQSAAAEYAVECAICKVLATEALAYVADEALQIHGGYGFSEEFLVARHFRDARVTRIYEGTNEINRLNIAQLTLRRLRQGAFAMREVNVGDAWRTIDATAAAAMKMMAASAQVPQFALGGLADLLMSAYSCQSVRARCAKRPDDAVLSAGAEWLLWNMLHATRTTASRIDIEIPEHPDPAPEPDPVAAAVIEREAYPF